MPEKPKAVVFLPSTKTTSSIHFHVQFPSEKTPMITLKVPESDPSQKIGLIVPPAISLPHGVLPKSRLPLKIPVIA